MRLLAPFRTVWASDINSKCVLQAALLEAAQNPEAPFLGYG